MNGKKKKISKKKIKREENLWYVMMSGEARGGWEGRGKEEEEQTLCQRPTSRQAKQKMNQHIIIIQR